MNLAQGEAFRAMRAVAPDAVIGTAFNMSACEPAGDSEARQLIDELYAAYSDGTAQSAGELLGTAYAGLAEQAFKSASRVLQEAEQAAPPANGTELGDEISMEQKKHLLALAEYLGYH